MKKLLCLFMAIIMLTGLCGCLDNQDVRGEINSGGQEEEESKFSLGQTADNTYKNDYLGISCTLPSDWVFYTDEEILELNNIVAGTVDEDIAKALENANIIYDMYATNPNDYSNINVNLEKLSAVQIATADLKELLEAQFDGIKSTFSNMGYTDINIAYEKITVDGKEFDGAKITAKIQGVDFHSVVFCFKKGLYLANVSLGSIQTDKTAEILSYFKTS